MLDIEMVLFEWGEKKEISVFKAWVSSFQIEFCVVLNMILVGVFLVISYGFSDMWFPKSRNNSFIILLTF